MIIIIPCNMFLNPNPYFARILEGAKYINNNIKAEKSNVTTP